MRERRKRGNVYCNNSEGMSLYNDKYYMDQCTFSLFESEGIIDSGTP